MKRGRTQRADGSQREIPIQQASDTRPMKRPMEENERQGERAQGALDSQIHRQAGG